ncbi:hypothetical protein AABB87_02895 [Roseateles sp. PN1]
MLGGEFYDKEGYFRHAVQGLEEKKQILYLLGPV